MYKKFNKKIVNKKKILDFKKKNRNKKIILCHGVFDIVHPGHIRHLIYAKQKADVLVVSITSDIHIKKGIYRPHVPENLRALNLAAFELVDYVIIDKNAEPYEILKFLKPDYFAKGFEYTQNKNLKTKKEIEILNSNIFPHQLATWLSATKILPLLSTLFLKYSMVDLLNIPCLKSEKITAFDLDFRNPELKYFIIFKLI